jgi:hypothetical protein
MLFMSYTDQDVIACIIAAAAMWLLGFVEGYSVGWDKHRDESNRH